MFDEAFERLEAAGRDVIMFNQGQEILESGWTVNMTKVDGMVDGNKPVDITVPKGWKQIKNIWKPPAWR